MLLCAIEYDHPAVVQRIPSTVRRLVELQSKIAETPNSALALIWIKAGPIGA
jgi:hypothetical protein